jgi:uncharacterized phage protein (TIGR01671 family)
MEREIKFRGKRTDNGEWVYGYYYVERSIHFIVTQEQLPTHYEIDPKTVGEYTGLRDKNGKEIYEGGVIKTSSFPHGERSDIVIKYDESMGAFAGYVDGRFNDWLANYRDFEKIGNIHENPNLKGE